MEKYCTYYISFNLSLHNNFTYMYQDIYKHVCSFILWRNSYQMYLYKRETKIKAESLKSAKRDPESNGFQVGKKQVILP